MALKFQVVPPCGGHRRVVNEAVALPSFKSCPRVGGISLPSLARILNSLFQVVPPCGGHLIPRSSKGWSFGFQVVPPCGGHPAGAGHRAGRRAVSSRAPVWGASGSRSNAFCHSPSFKSCPRVGGIRSTWTRTPTHSRFQVVPPCGGHPYPAITGTAAVTFQVVPPCGGHQGNTHPKARALGVSSRAPVWGASREEDDFDEVEEFQVVPPCGGHPRRGVPPGGRHGFQVVPPCGGHRNRPSVPPSSQRVSSRAPVWGASLPWPGRSRRR